MAELPPLINVHEDEIEAWGYIGLVTYVIMVVSLIILISNHSYKIYQDLFTPDRKSLNHRRQKPVINDTYKLNIYLSLLSCIFWFCFIFTMMFTYLAAQTDLECTILQKFGGSFGVVAKSVMYLLFLVRLHTIYGSTAHALSKKCMIISGTAIIIYNTIVIICFFIIWKSQIFGYDDGVNIYPNYCDGTLEAITAALYVMGDGAASAGFLYSFIVPLRRTMKAVANSASSSTMISSSQLKAQEKITYLGTKTTILTVVAIVSSFNLSLLTTLTDLNFIIGADSIFNSICIILMTPYYSDSIYYIKLCYVCIWLCAKKQFKYREDADDNNTTNTSNNNDGRADSMKLETTHKDNKDDTLSPVQDTQDTNITVSPVSYDTDIQLQQTAQELQPPVQNDNDNDNDYDKMDDHDVNEPTADTLDTTDQS